MKFDGYNDGGQRVIVRLCGERDTNVCDHNTNYLGATGTLCHCNAKTCNPAASPVTLRSPLVVILLPALSFLYFKLYT